MKKETGVRAAVEGYIRKNTPKPVQDRRTNGKPEKEVETACLEWMREEGFDINVVESKSTYSPTQGRYIAQAAAPGIADIFGNDADGFAVFVELKAPGRRSTLRIKQWEFLHRKIQTNCFAVCVDSQSLLKDLYDKWYQLRTDLGCMLARVYLLRELGKKPVQRGDSPDGKPLFDDVD